MALVIIDTEAECGDAITRKEKRMEYTVLKTCPICGGQNCVDLDEESFCVYRNYVHGAGRIQDVPMRNRPTQKERNTVREFLRIGICFKCQEDVFG